jgi:uncharacterized protein
LAVNAHTLTLDLTRFRQPASHVARSFAPADLGDDGSEAYRIAAPVVLEFDLQKDKSRFRVVGRVQAELELPCSRCLEPYRMTVDAPLDLRYWPESERDVEETHADQDVTTEDADASYYRDDTLDLGELLREQFYLAMPMKPLCREGCLGLCPQCGADRNTSPCGCRAEWGDPRLAVLKGLVETPPRDS